jgi:acyl carrier protein
MNLNKHFIAKELASILVFKLGIKISKLYPEAKLTPDLGLDSIDLTDLIVEIHFKFEINPDKLLLNINGNTTIEELLNFIILHK